MGHVEKVARRFAALALAEEALLEALADAAEVELAKLAKRFPKRRVSFYSGMGGSHIEINSKTGADYTYGGELHYSNWPEQITCPAPTLWKLIQDYIDNTGAGVDPGLGNIIYDNGEQIKGLPRK